MGTETSQTQNGFTPNKTIILQLQKRLKQSFKAFCERDGFDSTNLAYCSKAVTKAYKEYANDMNFISTRRLPNGIGRCKLAGIVMWRLYKSNFARYTDDTTCNRDNHIENPTYEITLFYVLQYILRLDIVSTRDKYFLEFKELEYQLRNRHINQESIALFFKMICKSEELLITEINKREKIIENFDIDKDEVQKLIESIDEEKVLNCCKKILEEQSTT